MQRTIHSRVFSVVYRTPKYRDIDACIKVCIHIVSAVNTLKRFAVSITNMITFRTSLRGICGFNNYQWHTIKQPFIFNKRAKLSKVPTTKFCSKLFISSFRIKPNIGQIFNGNSFALFFCRLYNGFTNGMIDYFCSSISFHLP